MTRNANLALANLYDAQRGGIIDPSAFLMADGDLQAQVIRQWANDNARHAATFADKVDAFLSDAQVGIAFLTPQLYRIETTAYMERKPSFDITRFFPVDSTGDMWDVGTLVYSMEDYGRAKFLAAEAFDMPFASTKTGQNTRPFHLAGIGYEVGVPDMQRAAKLGRSLDADGARSAVKASDRFIYGIGMTGLNPDGVNEKGWTGFVNNASAPAAQVANDGTGPSRLWSAKDPDLILRDINDALTTVETGTGETHVANTLALPTTAYNYIATKRVTDTGATILSFLQANNLAGESLRIVKSRALETAGTGGTRRMVAYDRDPDVLRFFLPGPHRFYPPFWKSTFVYEVAGLMNVGGLDIRLPKAIVYRDSF